ncbi:uncharacterized protein LOC100893959 isoform X2 [Strongylocentrotus purpuratus]|uniref:BEN domain-containing protein n=1 Tax=Strongylocentrotus purpuratus TaxID=7668 RepID=A0A7M7GI33_STRPU|nr:uncharacterized protein LOC100893959 isoform X2 [Strongylocentrotus purpuratus]
MEEHKNEMSCESAKVECKLEIKIELEEEQDVVPLLRELGNLEVPLAPPALPALALPALALPALTLPILALTAPAEASAEAQNELWRQTFAESASSTHREEINSLKRRVAALEEEVAEKDKIIAAIKQARQGTLFTEDITPKKRRLIRAISDLVCGQSVSSTTCSPTHFENEDPQPLGTQSTASSSSELVPLFPGGEPILTEIEKRNVFKKGTTKEALLNALLDAVFGLKTLALGNACGARVAVNKGEEGGHEKLDPKKLNQIKECVLRRFKTQDDQKCFSPKDFNRKINQKCGTARRSLKTKQNVDT